MKINYKLSIYLFILLLLLLSGSCTMSDKFPLSINDIDTTTIYNKYQDSIDKITSAEVNSLEIDNLVESSELTDSISTWTICTGVFKEKQNAKQKFQELSLKNSSYVIIDDSMFIVTTGLYYSKDSAISFRKKHLTAESYLLKVKPTYRLLKSFPD